MRQQVLEAIQLVIDTEPAWRRMDAIEEAINGLGACWRCFEQKQANWYGVLGYCADCVARLGELAAMEGH